LDRTYIGGIERGERNVALRNIEKIAKAFGASLFEMFRGVYEVAIWFASSVACHALRSPSHLTGEMLEDPGFGESQKTVHIQEPSKKG